MKIVKFPAIKPLIVIDTNIFVSALLGSKNCLKIYEAFEHSEFNILMSRLLYAEYDATLKDVKFPFTRETVDDTLSLIRKLSLWVIINRTAPVCRDKKDTIILDTAINGIADFIVSGDGDLLILRSIENIPILPPVKFIKLLNR